MNTENEVQKSTTAHKEEKILDFWKEQNIFQKTLEKEAPQGEFVFYDGPPFATGLPHYGHLLPGTVKDLIPRYKTMQGYHVQRRWGWDTHGLPIENLIEKELNLKTKKDIEDYGIEKFNKAARDSVLRYEKEWKEYVPQSGRFVDMENPYTSMDSSYMETGWWIFSELHKKGLAYEGFKAMYLCPRCETTLANFEVNQGYKDVTDISVTAQFELVDEPRTYFLAWTTTPWTLPGNVALAVGKDFEYAKVQHEENFFILAHEKVEKIFEGKEYTLVETFSGESLLGTSYRAPFDFYQNQKDIENHEQGWKVYSADFVTIEEGTGIVHIAPAFGSDDLELGKKYQLPMVQHVAKNGIFRDDFATTQDGKSFQGLLVKQKDDYSSADIEIIKYLAGKGLLFAKQKIVHSYPHCWRCGTPLINYATTSWYVDVPKIKDKLIEANKDISWTPDFIGEGRFGKWLEGAREWALSRSRFWGNPLPVWKDKDDTVFVASSVSHLLENIAHSGNTYLALRHGESENNISGTINADKSVAAPLTQKGRDDTHRETLHIKDHYGDIDMIFCSPFQRTQETAEIIRETLGLDASAIIMDDRLGEIFPGKNREGSLWHEAHSDEESQSAQEFLHYKLEEDAESIADVYKRSMEFLFDIESRYQNKKILIVSHGGILRAMQFGLQHYGEPKKALDFYRSYPTPDNTSLMRLEFKPFPHNENYVLDLHRPYIDEVKVLSASGEVMKRVEDVFDVWFDSGSMPYAQKHYPFENQEDFFEKYFPADFIAEGLDQTRGWFYVLLVLGVALFEKSPFKNVVVNGLVLAEDGKKMSKSLKNYPDIHVVLNNQGADALRLFLMASPLVRAEEHPFSEKGVQEVQSKVLGRLRNILSFYQLYQGEIDHEASSLSTHVLDRWIFARVAETNIEISRNLDTYQIDKAAKYIFDFVDDFSTWYLRRSRDRFKGDGLADKKNALASLKYALLETARMIAPFTPFIADELWLALKEPSFEESVHLSRWTQHELSDQGVVLINTMQFLREQISEGLRLRTEAKIKVRQPLASFTFDTKNLEGDDFEEYKILIQEELNVKNILSGEMALDIALNDELIKEGNMRDFIREIQELRKKENFNPQEEKKLLVVTDHDGKNFVESFKNELAKTSAIREIDYSEEEHPEIEQFTVGDFDFKILFLD